MPAGRTDAGVHARGQAVHFSCPVDPPAPMLQKSLNRLLPDDLCLYDLEPARETCAAGKPWNAMYWSTGKLYTYRFYHGHTPMDPMCRLYRHHVSVPRPLDYPAMEEAAQAFEGEYDFFAFSNHASGLPPGQGIATGTVRRVVSVKFRDEGDGYACADFVLTSALYKMVRNMMGALYDVGRGVLTADDIHLMLSHPHLFQDGVWRRTGTKGWQRRPAPAHGLTLESVFYDVGWAGKYSYPGLSQTVGGFSAQMAAKKGSLGS